MIPAFQSGLPVETVGSGVKRPAVSTPGDSADAIPPKTASAANSPIAARIDTHPPWLLQCSHCRRSRLAPSMLRISPRGVIQEVGPKEIERPRLRHIDSVSNPRGDMQGRPVAPRRQLFG